MCGIAGIVGGGRPDEDTLAAMATEMAHRGPDGEGIWRDEVAGLAFRRLAIIDLDVRSSQPQQLGPLHIVFNGEIYNYRELREELRGDGHSFVTEGDCEVLLHALEQWGEGALQRLNGMFAFALWNERSRTLTAACDAFGEKPLFWAQDGERLLFASDVRALLRAAPALSAPCASALGPYLARGTMPEAGQSFFARINRLPGSHLLRWCDGEVSTESWWHPRQVPTPTGLAEAADALRVLLLDAINLRLRSDVPVGTSLSGGVDSSAIVCLSAELAGDHRRHAFTARFPGFERDEWPYAEATAAAAGVVTHHAVLPRASELVADLEALVSSHEEPVVSSSVYAQYRVMLAAREAGVTVLLDGQGADELFGGYVGIEGWALRARGTGAQLRALARGGDERRALVLATGSERAPRAIARRHRLRLASPYASEGVRLDAADWDPPAPAWARQRGPLVRELARQAFRTSMPALLRYADRNSMAHGRELRLPFLDRRIAEFAWSLPAELLYRDGVRKLVLREAVRGLVPEAVLERREKVGFETPESDWMTSPEMLERIGEVVLDSGARSAELVDRRALEADVRNGRLRDSNGAWRALNLELWLRAFSSPPSPGATPAPAAARA
jgi:asparagine synthase (glutamine-hydrolysing)